MTQGLDDDPAVLVERLLGRVRSLEGALEARSKELRALQGLLCLRDLRYLDAMRFGGTTPRAFASGVICESLQEMDVEDAMAELWEAQRADRDRE